jgi:ADP-ribosyl-[dinitrogen reductase] hydrolase
MAGSIYEEQKMTHAGDTPEQQAIRLDRFRGVLLGLAVGDALGGPLEFQPPRDPDNFVTEMIGGGWQRLAPGEWTDDTAMTLCVVESLLTKKVFDPDDIARRFVLWMKSGPKDIGMHTQRVLTAISKGDSWEQASLDVQEIQPDNAPNGSLMRFAPLPLFFYRHPEYVAELSPVLSRITHPHKDCEWACVCASVTLAWTLLGRSKHEAVQEAYLACDGASEELRYRISEAMKPNCETRPTGWVLDTLEVALWSFLHTSSFEDALLVVVNRGDDADTVGAITGALAGARYGLSSIPRDWLEPLKERNFLLDYADRLFELAESFA